MKSVMGLVLEDFIGNVVAKTAPNYKRNIRLATLGSGALGVALGAGARSVQIKNKIKELKEKLKSEKTEAEKNKVKSEIAKLYLSIAGAGAAGGAAGGVGGRMMAKSIARGRAEDKIAGMIGDGAKDISKGIMKRINRKGTAAGSDIADGLGYKTVEDIFGKSYKDPVQIVRVLNNKNSGDLQ